MWIIVLPRTMMLFKLPDPLASDPAISGDGERFIVAVPVR
jgi:hypothetical protein